MRQRSCTESCTEVASIAPFTHPNLDAAAQRGEKEERKKERKKQLRDSYICNQHVVMLQVQAVVNGLIGSHNRVEAFVCLYARMVDKDNLWLVLYALKVTSHNSFLLFWLSSLMYA